MNKNLTRYIPHGFIAAGMMNIGGVLLFSRAFTNQAINQADPVVMSNFGLLMIIIWGLAYISVAKNRRQEYRSSLLARWRICHRKVNLCRDLGLVAKPQLTDGTLQQRFVCWGVLYDLWH